MVTIKIIGGLGNQIRCFYAGYYIAEKLGHEITLDITDYYLGYFRKYLLDFLNIPPCKKIWHSVDEPLYANTLNLPDEIKKDYDIFIDIDKYHNKNELLNLLADKKTYLYMGTTIIIYLKMN